MPSDANLGSKRRLFKNCGSKCAPPLNGPRDKLREEGNIDQIIWQAARWLDLLSINIDRIADRLEGVETNADWQNDLQQSAIAPTKATQDLVEGIEKEISVFKIT